ncbi:hypothetical protein MAR_019025 [Mya arenaria]|uniref:Uncharacterized protein n=1 Tax=Mya arenaria TaxID=6604 RepID=A0ABY7EGD5_MYAAR|nr:hypothetical protein MAR_019025 [Mya arenaria]
MATEHEGVCCQELEPITAKLDLINEGRHPEDAVGCIIGHPGFDAVCLDQYVLETAYYQYGQQYGEWLENRNECVGFCHSLELRMRFFGYRQLVRLCCGYLG